MARASREWLRFGVLAATALIATSGATVALTGCGVQQESADQPAVEQPADDAAGQQDDAPAAAPELVDPTDVSAATEEVGTAVGADGYTLTIDTLVVDEGGFGRAAYTLRGPVAALRGDDGRLALGTDAGLDDLQMRTATDGRPNLVCTYDADASTDDALTGTIYFDARSTEEVVGGLSWQLLWHDENATGGGSGTASTELVVPSKVLGARHFTDGDAATATLGPLGLALSTSVDTESGQFVDDLVTLHLADGTDMVVFDASDPSAGSSLMQSARTDGSTSYALPEGVDVLSVSSITLEGRQLSTSGEEAVSYTFTPAA